MSESKEYFVHESAYIDKHCQIGKGTKIWHFSHIMGNAKIGENCILGQNVYVADGAVLGSNVKVQNNVSIYTGVVIEDDVFLGPSCVLTNVTNPRSQIVRHSLYEKTVLRRGTTIGANATVVCGIDICLPETDVDGIMICPESGYRYKEIEPGVVRCLDLDEDSPLPPDKAIGQVSYDQFKKK
jgi:UDP-2-acetamido-3-amino-2,3-dideoxy-glucuronate N-acetyltransferase